MLRRFFSFGRDSSGLAAIEFALIAPVMVTLLLGTFELCDALTCRDRVTMLSSTGADLVAQETSVSATDVSAVFAAMNEILYPYISGNAKYVISSVVSDGKGGGTVAWSQGQNATALTVGANVTLPSGLMLQSQCAQNACSVVQVQVTYNYTSPVGDFLIGTIPMTQTYYARPRRSVSVAYTG